MWRGCCGICCICTVKDRTFLDPDGVTVTEEFTGNGVQDTIEESVQNTDEGSPFVCAKLKESGLPPCRQIKRTYSQVPSDVHEGGFGVVMTVAGPGSIGLPPIPGSAWSGAYSAFGATSYNMTSYLGRLPPTGFGQPQFVLTGTIAELTATFTFGALGGAIYKGSIGMGPPFDVTHAPVTLNLDSQTDPTYVWPTPITFTPQINLRIGLSHGLRWWRFYPGLATFEPDGSNPEITFCYDVEPVSGQASAWTDDLGTTPFPASTTFFLAMKQGSHLAFTVGLTPATLDGPHDGWYHRAAGPTRLNDLAWGEFTNPNRLITEIQSYVPDLSPGADPIVFGILYGGSTSGSFKTLEQVVRLDGLCIRIKRET